MKQTIQSLIAQAIAIAVPEANNDTPHVERTRDPAHGDFATNAAMKLAGVARDNPRRIAERIRDALPHDDAIERVEIAGPGFINFFLSSATFRATIDQILDTGAGYGRTNTGNGQRVLVEFVSANPTGPLHVGHGRGAAFGDCVARLLAATGHVVDREYYVNDAGRQMDILALSVYLRYLEVAGQTVDFPAAAYQGDYVADSGRLLFERKAGALVCPAESLAVAERDEDDADTHIDARIERVRAAIGDDAFSEIRRLVLETQLSDIRCDLDRFRVRFDGWFHESNLVASDAVDRALTRLDEAGHLYMANGATWFAASRFGDDKDRVVRRANGVLTYFATDIAYHVDKLERGYDRLIDILGADHHGYVARIAGSVSALTGQADRLNVLLVQFAILYRGAERQTMSTRAGQYVTLAELCDEVGVDAARLFYVMRANEQHLDFDLELAQSRSNDNPVYYIQYAHARICSVRGQLGERGWAFERDAADYSQLSASHETALIRVLSRFPEVVDGAAVEAAPHALVHYLREVADAFHSYYNAHGFLVETTALRNARLSLVLAAGHVLANGLALIGVDAPERM